MIHAYDKSYLHSAQNALGRMMDFAVYDLNRDAEEFFSLFVSTPLAEKFGRGEPSVVVGLSGAELAYRVFELSGQRKPRKKPKYAVDRSPEYWAGWALTYFQWQTSLEFEEIVRYIPFGRILSMYMPYHEMDVTHFCDRMRELYLQKKQSTNLSIYRERCGYSQSDLAELAGIPARTIQEYEQRRRDINSAGVFTVVKLARALYCRPEDLIEKVEAMEC